MTIKFQIQLQEIPRTALFKYDRIIELSTTIPLEITQQAFKVDATRSLSHCFTWSLQNMISRCLEESCRMVLTFTSTRASDEAPKVVLTSNSTDCSQIIRFIHLCCRRWSSVRLLRLVFSTVVGPIGCITSANVNCQSVLSCVSHTNFGGIILDKRHHHASKTNRTRLKAMMMKFYASEWWRDTDYAA